MIKTGKLIEWDKKKRSGLIQFDKEDRQIFVHISAFPKNSGKPQLNESIAFQINRRADGELMAVALQLVDRKMPVEKPKRRKVRFGKLLFTLIIWGLVITGGFYAYQYINQRGIESSINNIKNSIGWANKDEPIFIEVINPQNNVHNIKNNYQCRGRTHCSHVNSCEEATWVLRHCPNTKMDGDNDGVPCEKQWCR